MKTRGAGAATKGANHAKGVDRRRNSAGDSPIQAFICEAVTRPNMRFVPVKTLDQQGQLLVPALAKGLSNNVLPRLTAFVAYSLNLGLYCR